MTVQAGRHPRLLQQQREHVDWLLGATLDVETAATLGLVRATWGEHLGGRSTLDPNARWGAAVHWYVDRVPDYLRHRLHAAVRRLKPRDQALVEGLYVQHFTIAQIARALGRSRSGLYQRHRCILEDVARYVWDEPATCGGRAKGAGAGPAARGRAGPRPRRAARPPAGRAAPPPPRPGRAGAPPRRGAPPRYRAGAIR